MKIWEIIEACAKGGYIEGDAFVNELGQELYFDGETIQGLGSIDINSTWNYVEQAA